jgi:hypothetical protein
MTRRRSRFLWSFLLNVTVLGLGALALTAPQWMPLRFVLRVEIDPSTLRWSVLGGALAVLLVACNAAFALHRRLTRSISRYYLFHNALWPLRDGEIIAFPLCAQCRVPMTPVRQVYLQNESHWKCLACQGTVPAQTVEGRSVLREARAQAVADRKRHIRRRFRKARRRMFVAQD